MYAYIYSCIIYPHTHSSRHASTHYCLLIWRWTHQNNTMEHRNEEEEEEEEDEKYFQVEDVENFA